MLFRRPGERSLPPSSRRSLKFDSQRKKLRPHSAFDVIGICCIYGLIFFTTVESAPYLFHSSNDVLQWNHRAQEFKQSVMHNAIHDPVHLGGRVWKDKPSSDRAIVNANPTTHEQAPPEPQPGPPSPAEGAHPAQPTPNQDRQAVDRQAAVKAAMLHAYEGYEQAAFGHDELRPVSNITNDSWNGWGVTIFDGLDTMILMGMSEQVEKIRAHIATVDFNIDYGVSFFETTIRYLGGLLGAHAVSQDPLYADRAHELAKLLVLGFAASASGLPQSVLNLQTGQSHNHHWNGDRCILSEVGSSQIEYAALSHVSKDPSFYEKSRKVFTVLDELKKPTPGLYPVYLDGETGQFSASRLSFGSLADSFYEYLLKLYLLNGDQVALRMYNEAIAGMKANLIKSVVRKTKGADGVEILRKHTFIGEMQDTSFSGVMEHLSCFVPGMLALGAFLISKIPEAAMTPAERVRFGMLDEDLLLAEELLATCVASYYQSTTGLGPESFRFQAEPELFVPPEVPPEANTDGQHAGSSGTSKDHVHDMEGMYRVEDAQYILRPETVESLFVLYRITGKELYQDMGWDIFQAIETHCRTPTSYSGLKSVNDEGPVEDNWNDSMQSFFWAETLKYLYLLFDQGTAMPLDQFVFNTEAHPLAVLPGGISDRIGAPVVFPGR